MKIIMAEKLMSFEEVDDDDRNIRATIRFKRRWIIYRENKSIFLLNIKLNFLK